MKCNTCGTDLAARVRMGIDSKTGKVWEFCDLCGNVPAVSIPDVYLGSGGGYQTDENLCNPKTGVPIPFSTKREKLAIMKMMNVKQADCAERQHGARNEMYLHRKTYI
jgi:hypothetical protein